MSESFDMVIFSEGGNLQNLALHPVSVDIVKTHMSLHIWITAIVFLPVNLL